jgi:hypothetical protein
MKKLMLIICCLAAALFLLPGVMGSEGWGETLEISGEVTVAEEIPEETEEGTGDDADSGSANSDSPDSNSNSPQPELIKPNTADADGNIIWVVDIK